jgi:hypothetical protein
VPSESAPAPGEFRRYRRFVSGFILAFVSLGSLYLLVSVGLTIYRRLHAVPIGLPVGAVASWADIESCHEELTDVADGLEKHLENFHRLMAHYDAAEAQRWSEHQAFWLGQWKAAGERCQFQERRGGKLGKEWEALGVVHAELHETEASYTKELLRFGRDQAPRLDRIRESLATIAKRLLVTQDSQDSGDTSRHE